MTRYDSPSQFFWHYDKSLRLITDNDINRLVKQLLDAGYIVKEYKNGSVTVKTPDELVTAHNRRITLQKKEAAKYTKLGAAIPIALAQAFSAACQKLGVSQSEILLPIINNTIERANQSIYI